MDLALFDYEILGKIGMIASKDALYAIYFADYITQEDKLLSNALGKKGQKLAKLKPLDPTPIMLEVDAWLKQYERGGKQEFKTPFKLFLPPFTKTVLNTLFTQPYGKLLSYKDLAKLSGNPKAYRAVGSANNHNPLPIIIPCHRVVKSDGTLGGYGCGLELKKLLLSIEGVKL